MLHNMFTGVKLVTAESVLIGVGISGTESTISAIQLMTYSPKIPGFRLRDDATQRETGAVDLLLSQRSIALGDYSPIGSYLGMSDDLPLVVAECWPVGLDQGGDYMVDGRFAHDFSPNPYRGFAVPLLPGAGNA
jgi:hypothetical protein